MYLNTKMIFFSQLLKVDIKRELFPPLGQGGIRNWDLGLRTRA